MADVNITPKIRCDNCGFVEEKTIAGNGASREFRKPRMWGFLKAEGGRTSDSYGGKNHVAFADLCPNCANAALDAMNVALREQRKEAQE